MSLGFVVRAISWINCEKSPHMSSSEEPSKLGVVVNTFNPSSLGQRQVDP